MNEQQQLLAAIMNDKGDDTVRLVYADWLQEHGQEERADFIRVQCELAKYQSITLSKKDALALATDEGYRDYVMHTSHGVEIFSRSRNAEYGLPERMHGVNIYVKDVEDSGFDSMSRIRDHWYRSERKELVTRERDILTGKGREWVGTILGNVCRGSGLNWNWDRGFINIITCTAEDFIAHADEIYWHPKQVIATHVDGIHELRRPCPLTAQPLTKVVLTTVPDIAPLIETVNHPWKDSVEIRATATLGGMKFTNSCRVSGREIGQRNIDVMQVATRQLTEELHPRYLLPKRYEGIEF